MDEGVGPQQDPRQERKAEADVGPTPQGAEADDRRSHDSDDHPGGPEEPGEADVGGERPREGFDECEDPLEPQLSPENNHATCEPEDNGGSCDYEGVGSADD